LGYLKPVKTREINPLGEKKEIAMKIVYRTISPLIIAATMATCSTAVSQHLPADKDATIETAALFNHLNKLLDKGVIFGHQDDKAYGVNWRYEPGRSDVKETTGEYPGLFGWELGHLELDSAKSLDNVPFNEMKKFIKQGYEAGAAITISWHLNSPLNGKSAWDTTHGTVASIIPGGAKHEVYKLYLDRLADFLNDLKGPKGELIPILFRPFHEFTGTWFWWCQNTCTAQEYIVEVYCRLFTQY
jgi:hypothetical protein